MRGSPPAPSEDAVRFARSRFDARRWPLLVIEAWTPKGPDDVSAQYVAWDEYLARGPHGAVVDLSELDALKVSAVERQRAADEVSKRAFGYERSLVVEARVVPSTLIRNMVTAFEWLTRAKNSRPLRMFATRDEAVAWVVSELAKHDLHAPDRPRSVAPPRLDSMAPPKAR